MPGFAIFFLKTKLKERVPVRDGVFSATTDQLSLFVENSLQHYIVLTCFIAGGAAFLTGRALASKWRPLWKLLLATVLLGLALRFLHFALFSGNLLSLHSFLTDTATLLAFAILAFRLTRTRQMVTSYFWLYRRTSPLTWTSR